MVGAGLAMLPGSGLASIGVVNRQAIHLLRGATVIIVANSETTVAIVINVILVSLLFPIWKDCYF